MTRHKPISLTCMQIAINYRSLRIDKTFGEQERNYRTMQSLASLNFENGGPKESLDILGYGKVCFY